MALRSSKALSRWRALRHCGIAAFAHGVLAGTHKIAHGFVAGTGHTHAVRSPERDSRASIMASRRSVLTRSAERLGIDEGATTSQCPAR